MERTTNEDRKSTEKTQNRHRTDRETGRSQNNGKNRHQHNILHLEHFNDMIRTKDGNGIDVMDKDVELIKYNANDKSSSCTKYNQ